MKWNTIIDEVGSISVEEAKAYFNSHSSASYQLVDVRQPEEYSKRHLPGSLLIPLGDLIEGKGELDKEKTTILYSNSVSRSTAAGQWLNSQNFREVRYLEGGISAWYGELAFGHFDLNLSLLNPEAEFEDAISMAYAMEEGLQQFYIMLARETKDEVFKRLYRKLASFEVDHKRDLSRIYSISQGKKLVRKELEEHEGQILEGGGYADITLIKTLANTESVEDVFGLAAAFETQAMDFYTRLAAKAAKPEVKKFFLEMADAEKKHLAFVARELDLYLQQENRSDDP
jgi:rubrerythrin/rhodanese-related sulfurtransferase